MNGTDDDSFLNSYTLFLMAMASATVSAEFHRIAADQGLSVPEWRVLACLHDRKSATVTDLARLSLMEQSRLTHLIGRMQARGLVERQRSKTNRRSVEVTLSPDGATLARFGQMLYDHVRFEERELFERVQELLYPER